MHQHWHLKSFFDALCIEDRFCEDWMVVHFGIKSLPIPERPQLQMTLGFLGHTC